MTIELSKESKETIKFELEKTLYKKSFYHFLKKAVEILEPSTKFSWNWHIEYLCEIAQKEIERIQRGERKDKDILINVPPRTMKSLIFSVALNAWTWTFFGECRFMTISYSDVLASSFSYQTRLLIKSDWYKMYFPDVQLQDDDNRKTSYSNSSHGIRQAFGMTGSVTGSGADVIIVDDPQKPTDTSQVKLDSCVTTYRDTVYNRLNQPSVGVRFIIQQRCDEQDLTGYLLSHDPELYDHYCIPMELTKDVKPKHLMNRYEGELLWKERFDRLTLQPYAKNEFTYGSQYLQNPQPQSGVLIKRVWLDVIQKPEDLELHTLRWEAIIDSAYTANPDNDETGVIVCAKWNNYLLVKKIYVLYLEFPDLIRKLQGIYRTDLDGKGIFRAEAKANGLSIIQTLKREEINITKTETPKDDKVTRVTSILNELESRRVKILRGSGESMLIQQCVAFPKSKKDGLVDCLYYGVKQHLHTTRMKTRMIG